METLRNITYIAQNHLILVVSLGLAAFSCGLWFAAIRWFRSRKEWLHQSGENRQIEKEIRKWKLVNTDLEFELESEGGLPEAMRTVPVDEWSEADDAGEEKMPLTSAVAPGLLPEIKGFQEELLLMRGWLDDTIDDFGAERQLMVSQQEKLTQGLHLIGQINAHYEAVYDALRKGDFEEADQRNLQVRTTLDLETLTDINFSLSNYGIAANDLDEISRNEGRRLVALEQVLNDFQSDITLLEDDVERASAGTSDKANALYGELRATRESLEALEQQKGVRLEGSAKLEISAMEALGGLKKLQDGLDFYNEKTGEGSTWFEEGGTLLESCRQEIEETREETRALGRRLDCGKILASQGRIQFYKIEQSFHQLGLLWSDSMGNQQGWEWVSETLPPEPCRYTGRSKEEKRRVLETSADWPLVLSEIPKVDLSTNGESVSVTPEPEALTLFERPVREVKAPKNEVVEIDVTERKPREETGLVQVLRGLGDPALQDSTPLAKPAFSAAEKGFQPVQEMTYESVFKADVGVTIDTELGAIYEEAPGKRDRLERLGDISEKDVQGLHQLGIHRFKQIASWNAGHIAEFSERLGIGDRILRNHWVYKAQKIHVAEHGVSRASHWLAANRPRRLVFKNEGFVVPMRPITENSFLSVNTKGLTDSQVDSIFVTLEKGSLLSEKSEGAEFGQPDPEGYDERMEDLEAFDTDSLELMVIWGHKTGREVFLSIPVNPPVGDDKHDLAGDSTSSNPDLQIKMQADGIPEDKVFLDYRHQEVRARFVRIVENAISKYGVDGVEIDLMEFPILFEEQLSDGVVSLSNAEALTTMMREIRGVCQALAKRRKQDTLIAVRVPDSLIYCRSMGIYLQEWLEDSLVDIVVGGGDFQLDGFEQFGSLGVAYDVPVYAGISEHAIPESEEDPGLRERSWRGAAMKAWKAGVQGIVVSGGILSDDPLLRDLGNRTALAKLPRENSSFPASDSAWFSPETWLPRRGKEQARKPRVLVTPDR